MIYILIAVLILLVINLIMSFYILKKLTEVSVRQKTQDVGFEALYNIGKDLSGTLKEMGDDEMRHYLELDNDHTAIISMLTKLRDAVKATDINLTTIENLCVETCKYASNNTSTLGTIESYMNISKDTLEDICKKLEDVEEEDEKIPD